MYRMDPRGEPMLTRRPLRDWLRCSPAEHEPPRALIRLLKAHRFSDRTWQKLIETVSSHCADPSRCVDTVAVTDQARARSAGRPLRTKSRAGFGLEPGQA